MQYKRNAKTIMVVERKRERVTFSEISICKNKEKNENIEQNNRIGYIAEVKKEKEKIKFLQDSLSFL